MNYSSTSRPACHSCQSYQFYGFYDFGIVWNSDSNTDPNQSLASAGIGVRTNVNQWFSADFEVAQVLTRKMANRADNREGARYFFRLTGQF